MHLEVGVLLEAQKMSIEIARGDRVNPSDNSGKNWIVILLQICKNIGNKFIVTKQGSRRCELIGVIGHLGIIIGNRELILPASSEGNSRVHGSCMRLGRIEVSERALGLCQCRAS
jgi:hypothetical protein